MRFRTWYVAALGLGGLLLLIAVSMVFAAGLSYRYVVGAILCGLPVIYFVLMSAAYRRRRLMAFWDPWSDPLGDGFQVIQSQIAVGSGGLVGRGFMSGVQKLFYLPEPHTDFIYAVIGEEFGLMGTTIVLMCFMVIAWRGLKIAMEAPDRFGALHATGGGPHCNGRRLDGDCRGAVDCPVAGNFHEPALGRTPFL